MSADAPLRPLGLGRARRHPPARARAASACSSGRAASTARTGCRSTRAPSSCRASWRRSRPSSRRAISSPASGPTASSSPTRAPSCPGDRLRSVNWRASARRGELIVNERHPDRNADVVLFLDSFAEARSGDEADGTLERAVRAAATLAGRYLERRDRVGLVTFGGVLRWLEPGGGLVQRYRLIDALLETGVEFSYAWKDVNIIPARTLPPKALVIAVTPLLDERSIAALFDLRARGSRPRGRRGLAGGRRLARARRRRARLPALAPAPGRAAGAVRALGRRRGALDRRAAPSTPGSRG